MAEGAEHDENMKQLVRPEERALSAGNNVDKPSGGVSKAARKKPRECSGAQCTVQRRDDEQPHRSAHGAGTGGRDCTHAERCHLDRGSPEQCTRTAQDAEITMKVHDGYTMTLDCGNILPSSTEDVDATTKKYIFKSVKSNISCKATAKVSE